MKKAFTLAEVLLTLAIIGVVAALTIPAVITKVTQDQYVVALKKAYNTLKAVQREAEQEHGPMENWDWQLSDKDSFEKYFKAHFDILKDCGITGDGCFHNADEFKLLNGTGGEEDYNAYYYNFITSDGVAYSYRACYAYPSVSIFNPGYFTVDVNGKKGPNTWGRDIFQFDIFKKAGIKPSGALFLHDETQAIPSADVNNDTNSGCNTKAAGWYCAAKVLAEGAMNY